MEDGTYNRTKKQITHPSGYQVGLWNQKCGDRSEMMKIWDLMIEHEATRHEEFGIWTNAKNEYYIEPCVWISNIEDAFTIGKALNQESVWCWTTMKAIYIE